jgi:hypothetical protein
MFAQPHTVLAESLPRSSRNHRPTREAWKTNLENKKRGAGFTQPLPWLPYPPPEYFAKLDDYCSNVNAWQAAVVTTGALPLAPALNRTTPSSVAQKLRTPEML